jgi:hypothetical protein
MDDGGLWPPQHKGRIFEPFYTHKMNPLVLSDFLLKDILDGEAIACPRACFAIVAQERLLAMTRGGGFIGLVSPDFDWDYESG